MAPVSTSPFKFYFGTKAQYTAATKDPNSLYFITDDKQIYVGSDLYTGSYEFVENFPASPSQGILYCKSSTHETKSWNGTSWDVLLPPIDTSINASSTANDHNLADIGAIKEYVTNQIGDAYTLTKASQADTGYAATYQLFKGSTAVGDKINIPKDMVVESGSVKTATAADVTAEIYPGVTEGDLYIDLVIANSNSQHIYIPVNGLVEFPTVDDTNSVDLSIDANHKITADVRISDNTGNILSTVSTSGHEGLFAEHYIGSIEDTSSVDLDVTNKKLTAAVKVSADTGNKVQTKADGLFVAADYIGSIDDTNSVDLTVDANAKLTAAVKRSETAGNIITENADGIFAEHYIGSVTDGTTVDLTVTSKALTAEVVRSAVADNILEAKSDGLYATMKWNELPSVTP